VQEKNMHHQTARREILKAVLSSIALGFFLTPTYAEDATKMTGPVVEIVSFKLGAGVTEEAFLKAGKAAEDFMKSRNGFVSRRLSRREDGSYVDHVTWASMEDAKQAMDASMKEASLAPFMQAIDLTSMTIEHQALVSKVN
jgi:hypothetical protein